MKRDSRLSLEQSKKLSKARLLGQATALPIFLEDGELQKLISVIMHDINKREMFADLPSLPADCGSDYYKIPIAWFEEKADAGDFIAQYLHCVQKVEDFETYFECMCELHKRRKKYERILSAQPIPTMLQIAPRALLEFGVIATPALASWLVWRKWFYDIDNRAAQETGYLFEPILASALGGTPYGAKNSPIKRVLDNNKGRQVDCIVDRYAYEFKLRVTIAASGQGRFSEELDFAKDCHASNFTPILMVLDPTPSGRLTDLSAEYQKYGGRAYIGEDAWNHLEKEAGPVMATLIEKYVKRPIASLDEHTMELLDLHISANQDRSVFSVKIGENPWSIKRAENKALSEESPEE